MGRSSSEGETIELARSAWIIAEERPGEVSDGNKGRDGLMKKIRAGTSLKLREGIECDVFPEDDMARDVKTLEDRILTTITFILNLIPKETT